MRPRRRVLSPAGDRNLKNDRRDARTAWPYGAPPSGNGKCIQCGDGTRCAEPVSSACDGSACTESPFGRTPSDHAGWHTRLERRPLPARPDRAREARSMKPNRLRGTSGNDISPRRLRQATARARERRRTIPCTTTCRWCTLTVRPQSSIICEEYEQMFAILAGRNRLPETSMLGRMHIGGAEHQGTACGVVAERRSAVAPGSREHPRKGRIHG
jgi:hypothetical protein